MTDVADFIKQWEGCELIVYADPVGIPTAGVGHVCRGMAIGDIITQEQADLWLESDIASARALIVQHINVTLSDNQLAALTSLVFNEGVKPLVGTLGHLLNAGDYDTAALQFGRWIYAGGQVLQGLVRRRAAEQNLFSTPTEN